MLAPSNAIPVGAVPTLYVPTTVPSDGCTLLTTPPDVPPHTTQTYVPSKAVEMGEKLTVKLPRFLPSLARSLVRVFVPFGTQMLAPSNVMKAGLLPTVNVPRTFPVLACSFVTDAAPAFGNPNIRTVKGDAVWLKT